MRFPGRLKKVARHDDAAQLPKSQSKILVRVNKMGAHVADIIVDAKLLIAKHLPGFSIHSSPQHITNSVIVQNAPSLRHSIMYTGSDAIAHASAPDLLRPGSGRSLYENVPWYLTLAPCLPELEFGELGLDFQIFPFFDLPGEIRNKIYEFMLPTTNMAILNPKAWEDIRPFDIPAPNNEELRGCLSPLLVNWQMYNEFFGTLYSNLELCLTVDMLPRITRHRQWNLRHEPGKKELEMLKKCKKYQPYTKTVSVTLFGGTHGPRYRYRPCLLSPFLGELCQFDSLRRVDVMQTFPSSNPREEAMFLLPLMELVEKDIDVRMYLHFGPSNPRVYNVFLRELGRLYRTKCNEMNRQVVVMFVSGGFDGRVAFCHFFRAVMPDREGPVDVRDVIEYPDSPQAMLANIDQIVSGPIPNISAPLHLLAALFVDQETSIRQALARRERFRLQGEEVFTGLDHLRNRVRAVSF